jgi:hypothetical protein
MHAPPKGPVGISARDLARAIELLERQIEVNGSIVVKQPDVWGQARLTKYRDEYERQMAAELDKFVFVLNGSVAGADQAYLADAFALSAAASPAPQSTARGSATTSLTTMVPSPAPGGGGATGSGHAAGGGANAGGGGSGGGGSGGGGSGGGPSPLPFPDQSSTFAAFNNITRNPANLPTPLSFAGASTGISLEPPLLLDQKSHYLNHLQELRRINEGDDTADSPGYSLNLVRIPVSLLPGKHTDRGYGAEVTLSLRPYLADELLPMTFRNLVTNDLVDQLAFPITKFINDPDNAPFFDPLAFQDWNDLFDQFDHIYGYAEAAKLGPPGTADLIEIFVGELKRLRFRPLLQPILNRPDWAWIDDFLKRWDGLQWQQGRMSQDEYGKSRRKVIGFFFESLAKRASQLQSQITPQSKSRRSQLPFPPSQLTSVYGWRSFFLLAKDAYDVLNKENFSRTSADLNRVYVHLPDVQGYLKEKLTAVYELLKRPENQVLWEHTSRGGLSLAIRSDDLKQMALKREALFTLMKKQVISSQGTAPLTWAILVESALLNEKLLEDMRETASLKGCPINLPVGAEFFRPTPASEVRQAFNQYVQCRWPIHVFALDPAEQDQNLQSTMSTRREMQLSLSLAFVKGNISAQNMLNYARRLDFDYATIDLNGTAVGFSHGEEVFGWRFYPRFQTPDVESNATVFFRDLLWGGPNKNALLKQRRLEPGIRECYAVVIMPSFVPYATLTVSSSWFKLVNPRHRRMDTIDAMELSQRVKCLQNGAGAVADASCYRGADLMHLNEKVRQLEARLPLQSTQVQVPYENTLGGFAMFNAGITELAPQLDGWYGTSAINPNYGGTVFLVGNHFSVHSTVVIAGGQQVQPPAQQLLSRQVVQVTIPAHPMLVGDAKAQFVDVQIATPYGVTEHLLIPAVVPTDPSAGYAPPPAATSNAPDGTQTGGTGNNATANKAPSGAGSGSGSPSNSSGDFTSGDSGNAGAGKGNSNGGAGKSGAGGSGASNSTSGSTSSGDSGSGSSGKGSSTSAAGKDGSGGSGSGGTSRGSGGLSGGSRPGAGGSAGSPPETGGSGGNDINAPSNKKPPKVTLELEVP